MSYDKKGLMIVDKFDVPDLKFREIIYCGEVVEVKELPKILELGDDARKYMYSVSTVFRNDKEGVGSLTIRRDFFGYEDLLNERKERFDEVKIPFNEKVKQGLLKLLGC